MYFYTTGAQEAALENIYHRAIQEKQKELDKENKKRIPKFTARAYVYRPERVFYVENDICYYGHVSDETLCPNEPVSGGQIYTFDKTFAQQIDAFRKKHVRYKVVFKPDGTYGPCMNYNGSVGCMPAYLESDDGAVLDADDKDAYDIGCA